MSSLVRTPIDTQIKLNGTELSHDNCRSIVNGLRDDDEESFYGNRASFVSEYSLRDEGVQVFFKEHGRTGSKDSQSSSFLSRKKATQASSKRPETKVKLGIQMDQGSVASFYTFLTRLFARSSSARRPR